MDPMILLKPLIGRKVRVYSVRGGDEVSALGILDAAEGHFLLLRKDRTEETMLFSVHNVRMVEPQ